eukprot:252145-Hanusia_phi.AAC.1
MRKEEAAAVLEAAERADEEEERRRQEVHNRVQQMADKYRSEGGQVLRLLSVEEYTTLVEHTLQAGQGKGGSMREEERFKSDPRTLVCGEFEHAARGLEQLLQVPLKE